MMTAEDAASGTPPAPVPTGPDTAWPHFPLWERVRDTLYALPDYFESTLNVAGVLATDLHAFNTSLGATIEDQVAQTLNRLRGSWDPDEEYVGYSWTRQAQRFPDVILQASVPEATDPIIMGIELKGWYVLAKEREPSFRYRAGVGVCQPQDLLCVVPWALDAVVSGRPRLWTPYVAGARFAAEYRNYHWRFLRRRRDESADPEIEESSVTTPYPPKEAQISDAAKRDKGSNFGRFARTGLMDDYMANLFEEPLVGIPLSAWQRFFAIFSEAWTPERMTDALETITRDSAAGSSSLEAAADALRQIAEAVDPTH